MTGRTMADYLGVDERTITRWLNGQSRPARAALLQWALRTGVPAEWLMTGQVNAQTNEDYIERSPAPVYALRRPR